jgi:hypothetical protein
LEGPPSTPPGDFVQYLFQEKSVFSPKKICPRKSLRGLEVEIIEYTIKDVG